MSSRGVLLGDVDRANTAWNERIGALGEGAGIDVTAAGRPAEAGAGAAMIAADLFDGPESRIVMADLVATYTSATHGDVFEILLSMAGSALAIGVLTERQRWEGAQQTQQVDTSPLRMLVVGTKIKDALGELGALSAPSAYARQLLEEALELTGVSVDG